MVSIELSSVLLTLLPSTGIRSTYQNRIYRTVFLDLTDLNNDEAIIAAIIAIVQIIHKLFVLAPPGSVPSD